MDFSDRYEGSELPSDHHRRVLGNLSHPRSLTSLTRVLDVDASTRLRIGSPEIATALEDCVDSGWARSVGNIRDAASLVDGLPAATAKILRKRAEARPDLYLDEGEKFVLTEDGLAKLTGELPDAPPPLQGDALISALKQNVALAQEAVEAEHKAEGRDPKQIEAAEKVLAAQQAALDAAEA